MEGSKEIIGVTLYHTVGSNYYEIGQELLNREGKSLGKSVSGIEVGEGLDITVEMSDGEAVRFVGCPYALTLK